MWRAIRTWWKFIRKDPRVALARVSRQSPEICNERSPRPLPVQTCDAAQHWQEDSAKVYEKAEPLARLPCQCHTHENPRNNFLHAALCLKWPRYANHSYL